MDLDKQIEALDKQQEQLEKEIKSFNRKFGIVLFIILIFFSWMLYLEFSNALSDPEPAEIKNLEVGASR